MAWICPSCNFEENNDTSVRCSCGHEVLDTEEPNYTKPGGALLLVLLGHIVGVFISSIKLFSWFGTLQGETSYFVQQEIFRSSLVLIISSFMLFFMLKKSKVLPALMITFYVLAIIWTFSNYLIIKSMTSLPNYYDHLNNSIDHAVITFVGCSVWAAYFKFSKRVKNTFVN